MPCLALKPIKLSSILCSQSLKLFSIASWKIITIIINLLTYCPLFIFSLFLLQAHGQLQSVPLQEVGINNQTQCDWNKISPRLQVHQLCISTLMTLILISHPEKTWRTIFTIPLLFQCNNQIQSNKIYKSPEK